MATACSLLYYTHRWLQPCHLWFAAVIEDLVVGCECDRAKPHPEPYLEGMRRLGAAPEDCIVFEDSRAGVTAGVTAKVGRRHRPPASP